jgi:hypothetical protein
MKPRPAPSGLEGVVRKPAAGRSFGPNALHFFSVDAATLLHCRSSCVPTDDNEMSGSCVAQDDLAFAMLVAVVVAAELELCGQSKFEQTPMTFFDLNAANVPYPIAVCIPPCIQCRCV